MNDMGKSTISKALLLRVSIATTGGLGTMALFLVVSAPPNAIVFSTGLLDQKDFKLGGTIIGILGPLLAVLWVLLMI